MNTVNTKLTRVRSSEYPSQMSYRAAGTIARSINGNYKILFFIKHK